VEFGWAKRSNSCNVPNHYGGPLPGHAWSGPARGSAERSRYRRVTVRPASLLFAELRWASEQTIIRHRYDASGSFGWETDIGDKGARSFQICLSKLQNSELAPLPLQRFLTGHEIGIWPPA
jgi:hypothetical protein